MIIGVAALLASGTAMAGPGTALSWTWENPVPNGDSFNAIAYGNGVYVAAGQDGVIYMSSDGSHWTPQIGTVGMGGEYEDAIYGGGMFVVAGRDAGGAKHIASSSDGTHWSDVQAALTGNQVLSLAYGGNTYIALDGGPAEAVSGDGVNWVIHDIGFAPIGAAVYANGTFVVTGPSLANDYFSTDNGLSWTASPGSIADYSLIPVVSNGSAFFSFGYGSVAISTDGKSWASTKYSTPAVDGLFDQTQVLWDGRQFLAILDIGGVLSASASTDGVTWTSGVPISGPAIFRLTDTSSHTVQSTGSGYVATGVGPLSVIQSTNFSAWSPAFAASGPTSDLSDVVYAGGRYVAVGASPAGAGIMESNDAVIWKSVYTDSGDGALSTVAYGAGTYAAASRNGGDLWVSSTDGVSWNAVTVPPQPALSQIVYGNGVFVAFVGTCASGTCSGVSSVTSPDGRNWTAHALPTGFVSAQAYEDIGYSGTRFVALGGPDSSGMVAVFTSSDGITWTSSSSFSAPGPGNFYRIRTVSNGMAALGISTIIGGGLSIRTEGIVAFSQDGVTWAPTSLSSPLADISFDGGNYYASLGDSFTASQLVMSADGASWTTASGAPIAAMVSALWTNGNTLVAVGAGGDIVTGVQQSTGGQQSNGGGGSKGGGLDLLTLAGLLGLAALRRRGRG